MAFCGSKRVQKIPKTVPKQAKEKKPTGRKKERKQNRTEGMEALEMILGSQVQSKKTQ
jgi:hypothetical protein